MAYIKQTISFLVLPQGPQVAPNVSIKREVSVTEASADNGQHSRKYYLLFTSFLRSEMAVFHSCSFLLLSLLLPLILVIKLFL